MRSDPLAALDAIPREQLPSALARLAARLLEPVPVTSGRMLAPVELAKRLGVHPKWVYRHADQLGGERIGDRTLRFPEDGLAERIALLNKRQR